ncbi:MAG: hypothetical protein D3914_17505 [Candidatus Electrothrix sp. LOE2]|nr:hypothetical protein [Candidatus Electrothrix sp. LOE2]
MKTSGCEKKSWASLTVCIREKQGQNAEQRHLAFCLKIAFFFSYRPDPQEKPSFFFMGMRK